MKIDPAKTFSLLRGGLTDHENTWKSYLENTPPWQETAVLLTAPMVLANVVLAMIFSRLVGGYSYMVPGHGLVVSFLISLLMAVVGVAIATFCFNFLAGVFSGKANFSRAFAAVSLATIPAWLAGIVGALIPGIGFLVSLAGAVVSLVFLYKIIPLALFVPDEKRAVHFIASLVLAIVLQFMVAWVLAVRDVNRTGISDWGTSNDDSSSAPGMLSGLAGQMERQGRLLEKAQMDQYQPPESGELDRKQVRHYVNFMQKAQDLQQQYVSEMQDLAAKIEREEKEGKTPSVSDVSRMYSGVSNVAVLNNPEMEIVVTGGGNWAEHQWVKEQLRIARIQQGDGPEPIPHNYAVYQEFEDQLEDFP